MKDCLVLRYKRVVFFKLIKVDPSIGPLDDFVAGPTYLTIRSQIFWWFVALHIKIPSPIARHVAYLKYVIRHKYYVFLGCLKFKVPIWRAIFHDWDKFLPSEWGPYARTFHNKDGSKRYQEFPEFALAWKLHQSRNKHHWQWWLCVDMPLFDQGHVECQWWPDGTSHMQRYVPLPESLILVWDRGDAECLSCGKPFPKDAIVAMPMPETHIREMLADWYGAGWAITGKPEVKEWYAKNSGKMKLHEDTRKMVEELLETEL